MDILLLCLGVPLGIMAGLIPAMGASLTLVLVYSFIEHMSFDMLLAFYAVFITSIQFSGSVVALWAGIPGEVTSLPILKERPSILANQQLSVALLRTAIGSAAAAILSLLAIGVLLFAESQFSILLRTEIIALILAIMILVSVWWGTNNLVTNLVLIAAGLVISNVGYHVYSHSEFLTFDQPWLYGGIPFLPVLLGVYAVPALIDLLKNKFDIVMTKRDYSTSAPDPLIMPILRGTSIGFVLGLVPVIGVIVSSTVSHYVETKFKLSTALSRITAAESANNAAVVSVLIPLLLYGIAIQPSEAIILNILQNNLWTIQNITSFTFILGFFCVLTSVLVCYIISTVYAKKIVLLIKNHTNAVFVSIVLLLFVNVIYIGLQSSMGLYYLIVFLVFLSIGGILKYAKIDLMPFIFMFVVGDTVAPTFVRLYQLYF